MPSGFVKTSAREISANPQKAIDHVTEAIAGVYVKQSLAEAWYMTSMPDPSGLAWPDLCDDYGTRVAMLMNGTTTELQNMLRYAKVAGTEGFWSRGDCLLVWYLRRKAGTETKSLVLVAPKRNFLGVRDDDPRKNYANQRNGEGWHFMGVSKEDDGTPGYYGLSLSSLIQDVLPNGKDEKAWW